ncbi:MAG: ArsR family transcriptional regulator [Candidatus Hodarchaeales archaeon]
MATENSQLEFLLSQHLAVTPANGKRRRRLPRSVKKVYNLFETTISESLKIKDIIDMTGMSKKTVRFALNWLLEANIVGRHPDLEDLRTYFYYLRIETQ